MFGDGPAAPADSNTTDYIQPTLAHGLRIWWAFYWRDGLVAFVLGLQLGAAVQWLVGHGIVSERMRPVALQVGIYGITYIPAIFVMYYIVRKQFRGFRIRLTSIADGQPLRTLEPIPRRIFRIWWTYTWRTVTYTLALSVAMTVPMGFLAGAATVISPTLGKLFGVFQTLVVAGGVGLFVIYSNILDEEIADFSVGLVPTAMASPNPEAAPTRQADTTTS
jgi:hypothetical protein